MIKLPYRIIAIFAAILLTSCGEEVPTYTIEEVDGVKVVNNLTHKWGEKQKSRLEFVRKIGGLDVEDDKQTLYRPSDVTIDSEGNIYIIDLGNYRIVKYSEHGNYLMSFGSKGQGPGEFSFPNEFAIDESDKIYVSDFGNGRIQVYDQSGKYVSGTSEKLRPANFVRLHSGENAIFNANYSGDLDNISLVTIIDQQGKQQRSFAKPKYFENIQMKLTGNTYSMVNDNEDNIYLVFRYQNRLEKYSGTGKLQWRAKGLLEDKEMDNFESKTAKDSNGADKQISLQNEFLKGVALDKNGRLWVSTLTRQPTEEELANRPREGITFKDGKAEPFNIPKVKDPDENIFKFDIYDNNGVLLGHIQEKYLNEKSKFRIFDDRLFIVDPETEMAVYEYKIIG